MASRWSSSIYLVTSYLLLSGLVAGMLEPLPNGAGTPSSMHTFATEQALSDRILALESLAWPQVTEQSWPDCTVGPDNYKYVFLGAVPVGTKELHIDLEKRWEGGTGPLLCLRRGGPPLPTNKTCPSLPEAASAAGWATNSSFPGACAPFVAGAHLTLSEDHVLEGPWWLALFTDPSDTRFQSKMIQRGPVYPFSLNVSFAGCGSGGQGCQNTDPRSNQAGVMLERRETPPISRSGASQAPLHSASQDSLPSFVEAMMQEGQTLLSTLESTLPWPKTLPAASHEPASATLTNSAGECYSGSHSFPLFVPSPATFNISLCLLQSPNGGPLSNFSALLRWGALPVLNTTGTLAFVDQIRIGSAGSEMGLLEAEVQNVRAGWWYLRVVLNNVTGDERFCVDTWQWEDAGCREGRAGERCAWPLTRLGRVLTGASFTALYRPASRPASSGGWFALQMSPPMTTIGESAAPSDSSGPSGTGRWAYLSFGISDEAAGQTLSLEARWPGDPALSHRVHLFTKLGAIPETDSFDFAASYNGSKEANDKLKERPKELVIESNRLVGGHMDSLRLTIQYPAAGTWYVGLFVAPLEQGLRVASLDPPASNGEAVLAIEMRVRVGGCPGDCSGHGTCASYFDEGMARVWSTCECDRTHGGGDCTVEVLSPGQESRHVLALTLSNAAAIPAAGWAFTHQAYPEWIVFTCGGMASAVYHMCDAGGTCLASYGTLQFADFLLSFLAVVLTCLHLAPLPPRATAPAQLGATLLLAMIARDNATSGWNLVVVAALGALALALGWGLEAGMHRKQRPEGPTSSWGAHMRHVLQAKWLHSSALPVAAPALVRWVVRRYRWPYLVGGLAMLALAAAAWAFESGRTYWIWHSLWHVSIFMCPFFLLSATTAPRGAPWERAEQDYASVLGEEPGEGEDADELELRLVVDPLRSHLQTEHAISP